MAGFFMAYKWGVILATYKSWGDPPRMGEPHRDGPDGFGGDL